MRKQVKVSRGLALCTLVVLLSLVPVSQVYAVHSSKIEEISIDWKSVICVSKTTPTLQVVVTPPLRRGSRLHDRIFGELRSLQADYVRYVPWLPYPRLAVAELQPPADGKESWDFSVLDPVLADFLRATQGHSTIVNFSTIPEWMFKTAKPVLYPADPNQVTWGYEQGTELRDPSLRELGDYYARVVSWYTRGGFKDEHGKWHESGHHFPFPYWEVLNEVDLEHFTTPEGYTARYDAIVSAIRKISPQTKFVGMALAGPSPNLGPDFDTPKYFEYFLNRKNHRPGIPLDMISYHAYAEPAPDEDFSAAPFTFFDQADQFLREVRYIEAIRKRLSPETRTTIDELGSVLPSDFAQMKPGYVLKPIPRAYWNLSAAFFAYIFAHLARLGIDVVGESQLLGYPGQFPSVTMLDWKTGQPNARFWVLKLLHDNFGLGDKLVLTSAPSPYIYAQGFITRSGRRKVLLLNKRERPYTLALPGAAAGEFDYVDQTTATRPPAQTHLTGERLTLNGFAVAVVTPRTQPDDLRDESRETRTSRISDVKTWVVDGRLVAQ